MIELHQWFCIDTIFSSYSGPSSITMTATFNLDAMISHLMFVPGFLLILIFPSGENKTTMTASGFSTNIFSARILLAITFGGSAYRNNIITYIM